LKKKRRRRRGDTGMDYAIVIIMVFINEKTINK